MDMNQADQPGMQRPDQPGIQSSKFSFDLEYDLCVQPQQSSQQLQLSKIINKELAGIGNSGPQIPSQKQSGEQLKTLIQKLKPNDTIIWKNKNNKYQYPS